MSINKPKLSSLVRGQLPEFIQEDYQTFVAFLEAYYEYLETNVLVDIETASDIDTTFDSFVEYFKSELALNFPNILTDERFLLPRIKELYTAKGTEAAYKLLFRILYNKDVEIEYPVKQILKPSDGKYVQNVSIFVQVEYGNIESIIGNYVDILTSNKKIKVFADRYVTIGTNIYQIYLTGGWTGTFYVDDIVQYDSIFFGKILPTTSSFEIVLPGRNFRVGQVYDVIGTGTGARLKVTSVDNLGGIKTAKFVEFGIGYASDYTLSLLSSSFRGYPVQDYFSKNGTDVTISDSISNILDTGIINRYDYAYTLSDTGVTYADSTYAGTVATTFANTTGSQTSDQVIDPVNYAAIKIKLGAVAKYPGYYENNDGFLSDTIYVQDSKYYQTFSYVLKVDEMFDSYKSIVKKLLHPAGTEVFGEYSINNSLNIPTTIKTFLDETYLSSEDGLLLMTENSMLLITENV